MKNSYSELKNYRILSIFFIGIYYPYIRQKFEKRLLFAQIKILEKTANSNSDTKNSNFYVYYDWLFKFGNDTVEYYLCFPVEKSVCLCTCYKCVQFDNAGKIRRNKKIRKREQYKRRDRKVEEKQRIA